jgi:cytochrome P450 PksS
LLGIPARDRLRFYAWSKSMVEASSQTRILRAVPNVLSLFRYLRRVFAERRAHPQEGLVTVLVQAEEAGDKLNEDELLAMMFLLLVAGFETTTNLIASGTLALLQHPKQRDRFRRIPHWPSRPSRNYCVTPALWILPRCAVRARRLPLER